MTAAVNVDTVFRLPGGGALYDTHPLQRCFRDIHGAAQHVVFSIGTHRAAGRVLQGLEPDTSMF